VFSTDTVLCCVRDHYLNITVTTLPPKLNTKQPNKLCKEKVFEISAVNTHVLQK